MIVVAGLLAGISGLAAQPGRPDLILQGPAPPTACAGALDGPDYVPGMDANGQVIARADIGAEPIPVPGEILMPLPNRTQAGRGGRAGFRGGRGAGPGQGDAPYLVLDGKRVERLVNPEPACTPGGR